MIGGGQSGAEIVLEMLGDKDNLPENINWISRRPNLFMLEDSPFINEWFHPSFHNWYQKLGLARRKELLQVQRMASDGISEKTLKELYDYLYQSRIQRDNRLNLLLSSNISEISANRSGHYELCLQNKDIDDRIITLDADVIVLATGYRTVVPPFLEPLRSCLSFAKSGVDEEVEVGADFGTHVEGAKGCRIYVQNGTRLQHGVANPNMALLAMRSAQILNSVAHFEVAPGGFSEPHEHTVSEIWCITAGKAEVIADGVTLNIEAGSFVYIEQGSSHQLRNIGSETIKAVSVWWSPEDHNADN